MLCVYCVVLVVKLVPKPACAVQVAEIEASARFGDLIEFVYPIGYAHWGVYDGDGYVIHFSVAGRKTYSSVFQAEEFPH